MYKIDSAIKKIIRIKWSRFLIKILFRMECFKSVIKFSSGGKINSVLCVIFLWWNLKKKSGWLRNQIIKKSI